MFTTTGPTNSFRDSGESDVGIALNGEEDYYDSLSSRDDNELLNSESNRTGPLNTDPAYNPEPGIHYNEPLFNPEPSIHNQNNDQNANVDSLGGGTSSNSTYSTIVNGVKIKSLPGPRGIYSAYIFIS